MAHAGAVWARAAVLLLALLVSAAWGQALQPVPELTARVIDTTATLDAIERKGIEDKLAALERSKGAQVAFLIVATTQPEDIASYANRVGNAWKIGRKGVGDGLLLVVAKEDRRVRIEVAKTLEGAIPDLAAKQIVDEAITPAFRQGNYAAGLQAAADRITALVNGEALPPVQQARTQGTGGGGGFDWFNLAILLFFAVPVLGGLLRRVFGRKFGSMLTGAGVGGVALLVTSSLVIAGIAAGVALLFALLSGGTGAPGRRGGWSGGPVIGGWGGGGGGGFGGGGGGFSSGGGGDFGGGGASGDW